MSKHTPGPWEAFKHGTPDYAPQYGVHIGGIADFCIVKGDNAKADAQLIAAAPDLLDACEAVVDAWESGDLAAAARQCSAAIAKARPE